MFLFLVQMPHDPVIEWNSLYDLILCEVHSCFMILALAPGYLSTLLKRLKTRILTKIKLLILNWTLKLFGYLNYSVTIFNLIEIL